MDKRQKQIIIVLIALVLILAAAILIISKGSYSCYFPEPGVAPEETEPAEKTKIDTLNVTYWNPWGGPMPGNIHVDSDYPAFTLSDYTSESVIIVSVTVTELVKWTDETEEGKRKLETFGSPWIYPHGKECYMTVNDVLKGNFEINQIYLKTDMEKEIFAVGEEYILFIKSEDGESYQIRVTEGYLTKNSSVYEGMDQNISISKEELKHLMSFSDDEIIRYQNMAYIPQVFIGEMLTSTDENKSISESGMEVIQLQQVRVSSTIKGNLSGIVNFTCIGPDEISLKAGNVY